MTWERIWYLAKFDVVVARATESAVSAEPCSCLLLSAMLRPLNEMTWADSFAIALTMAMVHATEAMAIITCLSNVTQSSPWTSIQLDDQEETWEVQKKKGTKKDDRKSENLSLNLLSSISLCLSLSLSLSHTHSAQASSIFPFGINNKIYWIHCDPTRFEMPIFCSLISRYTPIFVIHERFYIQKTKTDTSLFLPLCSSHNETDTIEQRKKTE